MLKQYTIESTYTNSEIPIPSFMEMNAEQWRGVAEMSEAATQIKLLTNLDLKDLVELFAAGWTVQPPPYNTNFWELRKMATKGEN